MLNEDLKKEGLRALKLWNGMMIGSLVLVAAGLALTGAAAIKMKINDKIEAGIKAKTNDKLTSYGDISSILRREDEDDDDDDPEDDD